jgi:hypothetical protein
MAIVTLFCATGFAGCISTKSFKRSRVSTQDEVGGVHLAVTSVSNWDTYRKSLQPSFTMDEKQALAEVVPTTMLLERTVRDLMAANLKLAPPQSTVSSVKKITEATGEETKTEETTEQKKSPGDISAMTPSGETGGAYQETAGLPAGEKVLIDPIMKYDTATALMQHVELLNRDFLNAAIRKDWQAYVLRIQISLQPLARNLPYDAYTTISFFHEKPHPPAVGLYLTDSEPEVTDELPAVLPLLVTNNVEAAMRASAVETIRQYALSLLFMIKGLGGQVDFDKDTRELEKVLGRDYNSLLSVARVTDNTFRIRLGAMQQSTAQYATIPRAHTVTVMLLVPKNRAKKDNAMMYLMAKTCFVDANTGRELPCRSKKSLKKRIEGIHKYRMLEEDYGITFDNFATAALHVHNNDYNEFKEHMKKSIKIENIGLVSSDQQIEKEDAEASLIRQLPSLWLELAVIKVGSQYDIASFQLPLVEDPDIDPEDQVALLLDDGNTLTTTLRGCRGLDAFRMSAMLRMEIKQSDDSEKIGKNYTFVCNEVSADETGKLILSFPSLSKWGLKEEASEMRNSKSLSISDRQPEPLIVGPFNCVYLHEKEDQPPGVTMVPNVETLEPNPAFECPLTVAFDVKDKKAEFLLKVIPGKVNLNKSTNIDSEDSEKKDAVLRKINDDGEFMIKKSGHATLHLTGLTPKGKAKLVVHVEKGKPGIPPESIELPIKELEKKR